ncbi:MAG TPA: S41 family peptidase [Bacteroidetes bacterium]|nr:S41 family peptidase [Bacteroidota bacterium]
MNQIFRHKRWLLLLLPLIVLVNFSFYSRPADDDYFEITKNLDIFGKMYREVHSFYVDDIEPTEFMRTGINAMLKSLDPYTNYISASEIEDYRFMSTGQYGGIGAVIGKVNDRVVITEPYAGYPAVKAGLIAGDEIIQIDAEKISKENVKTLNVRNLLRGQPKTKVTLKIRRDGSPEPFDVEVERADIKIPNVPYQGMIDDKVGYISLTGFTSGASKEVKAAIENLKKDNPGLKGIVLDLRGNPGGLLYEAIDISNLFVPQGEKIVETRGKSEGTLKTYSARNNPVDQNIPLAVLINRRSASASEIVSGVMQDLDRGVIVGQRSFGKGLVQTTRPLSFNSQIKVTTAKYYTPSGRCIQAIDYSHRNEDGSVGKIADSLQKSFSTAAGRTVKDGGGIQPDIEVEIPDYHTVTQELMRQSLVFDFATRYRVKHESIASSRDFKVTDAVYNEFVAFCKEKDFKFETKTEKEFARLKELMEEEKYADALGAELAAIETKISAEKAADLMDFKDEISNFLQTEIVKRYYYRSGETEASFDIDPDILAARKVLENGEQYKKLLSGN